MAVLLETSVGDIVIDLYVDDCPITTKNFLKLCKVKFYNNCLFFNLQPNYIVQTGDPTGTGRGGISIYGKIYGEQASMFEDEFRKSRRHNKVGLVSMANTGKNTNRSQFFITLRSSDLSHLDDKHTIFGEVAEGFDALEALNNLYIDEEGRPYQDVRIKHCHILDDPFPDPIELEIPPKSPEPGRPHEESVKPRIPYEEKLDLNENAVKLTDDEIEAKSKKIEAQKRAIVLEMTGDIPDAEVKPPEEVLFVCKLNPVTTDEDLELIFSRFGKINKCEIIRDFKTGDSLNYAFIEFETEEACIEAYEKMNNVLIDDRRIKVDFSQSVSKLWNKYLLRPRSSRSQGKALQQGSNYAESSISNRKGDIRQGGLTPSAEVDRSIDGKHVASVAGKPSVGKSSYSNSHIPAEGKRTVVDERGAGSRGHFPDSHSSNNRISDDHVSRGQKQRYGEDASAGGNREDRSSKRNRSGRSRSREPEGRRGMNGSDPRQRGHRADNERGQRKDEDRKYSNR